MKHSGWGGVGWGVRQRKPQRIKLEGATEHRVSEMLLMGSGDFTEEGETGHWQ